MPIHIQSFYHKPSGTWSYVVSDKESKQCAIIDPVLDFDLKTGNITHRFADQIIDYITSAQLSCNWLMETHAHADHLTAAGYLQNKIGGKTIIGTGICQIQRHFSKQYQLSIATDGSQFDRLVEDGDQIKLGKHHFTVFSTPGHTSDSIIYCIDEHVFLGDTFFHPQSGTARCDFPGGSAKQLFNSLQTILKLADDSLLWLCHDYPGTEREAVSQISISQMRNNIHLLASQAKGSQIDHNLNQQQDTFVQLRENRDTQLNLPALIKPSIKFNICAGKLELIDESELTR